MKKKLKGFGILAASSLALLFIAEPARAVFGLGDVVFDPTSWATLGHIWEEDISTTAKLVKEIEETQKIVQNGLDVYRLANTMAQSFNGSHKAEWLTLAQTAAADYTEDKYGENSKWSRMLNGNPNMAQDAWGSSTTPYSNSTFLNGNMAGNPHMRSMLASMEQLDGSSVKCLSTISQYRGNSLMNLAPILKLAIARADGTADTNGEVKQLSLLNAGSEHQNNEQRAQGALNSCLVEQQIMANKIQRDKIANELNLSAKVAEYTATEGNGWGNAAEALRAR